MERGITRRVVLITGGVAGIGRATAELLGKNGDRVFVTSRTAPVGIEASGLEILRLDPGSDDSIRACIKAVVDGGSRLDVLINNIGAGIAGSVEETSVAEASAVFDANFWAAVRLIQAVLPIMRKQGAGRIVNLSSVGGQLGLPYRGFYSASKFALEGLSEALRLEVGPFGIRVTLIEPSGVRTPVAGHVPEAATVIGAYRESRRRVTAITDRFMMNGMPPERVAHAIAGVLASCAPRPRHSVGWQARTLNGLARLGSDRLLEVLKRRMFALPRSMSDKGE